jgi:DNA-binding NarL/FixJ family response regulator
VNINVVVVDDFPLVRAGLVAAIQSDPAIKVVGEAEDAITGFEVVQRVRPDVVLLDLYMPGGGGMMLLERLTSEMPEVRALVFTATRASEMMFQAIAAGAAGYLSKRASQHDIIDALVTVHGGGSVVSPHLASELLNHYAATSRGEGITGSSILTSREQQVLRLMSQGLTDREIAAELYISPRTVQNQLASVRRKTGRRRRAELTRWATEHMIS